MRKWINNHQIALKSALFIALAANIMSNPFDHMVNVTDLHSSETGLRPTARPADLNVGGHTRPKVRPSSVTAAAARAAAENESVSEVVSTPEGASEVNVVSEETTLGVCNRTVDVTYQELTISGQLKTEIIVRLQGENTRRGSDLPLLRSFSFKRDGSIEENRSSNQASINDSIKLKVEKDFAEAGVSCNGSDDRVSSEEELVCSEHEGADRIRCHIERIMQIQVDYSEEDEAKAASRAMRKLEDIYKKNLKSSLRSRCMSRDPDKNAECEELIEEAVESIITVADENGLPPEKVNRLIGQLKALAAGGATHRLGLERQEEIAEMGRELKAVQARIAAAELTQQTNPNMWTGQELIRLYTEQTALTAGLGQYQNMLIADESHGPYAELHYAKSRGFISGTDFRAMSGPMDDAHKKLRDLMTPGISADPSTGPIGSTANLPADFASIRAGLSARGSLPSGMYDSTFLTERPNINFPDLWAALGNHGSVASTLGQSSLFSAPGLGTQPVNTITQPLFSPPAGLPSAPQAPAGRYY